MADLTHIVAVVVTHNRAAKLARVLDALAEQTRRPDVVLVVDNASEDETAALLAARTRADPRLRFLRLPKNIGGAGGFHAGIKAAHEMGAQHIWVSDDDAYPEPQAIERLWSALTAFEAETAWRPAFACSRVEWIDGTLCEMNCPRTVWDWPRYVTPERPWALVDSCSFVSVLIPRWAVTQHGFPIADYFIWFDDAEYTRRIAQSYPGLFVPESRVIHDTPINQGVNFARITDETLWKFRYGARNEASFRRRSAGLPSVAAFLYAVRAQMIEGGVPLRMRGEIYLAIARGVTFSPPIERPSPVEAGSLP